MTEPQQPRSFAEFYRGELAGQVRRAALIVGSTEQAREVVQDAMVEVYRRWDTLTSPGGYLNRAVLNGCRDVCRRRSTAHRLLRRVAEPAGRLDALADLVDNIELVDLGTWRQTYRTSITDETLVPDTTIS